MCPTFHCNPTVLYTFNYYSKYIVNTDLQWFAVKSPLLHCILITLLIIPYLCHFDSTSFVLLIRPKYGILNRVIRVLCMQQISGLDSERVMSSQGNDLLCKVHNPSKRLFGHEKNRQSADFNNIRTEF